jgi:hypothetical protein
MHAPIRAKRPRPREPVRQLAPVMGMLRAVDGVSGGADAPAACAACRRGAQ